MPRRVRNWKPDIYDLTTRRIPPAPPGATPLPPPVSAEGAVVIDPLAPVPTLMPPPPRQRGDNDTLVGLIVGALAGAALTLLVTPASGAALRARFRAEIQALTGDPPVGEEAVAQDLP